MGSKKQSRGEKVRRREAARASRRKREQLLAQVANRDQGGGRAGEIVPKPWDQEPSEDVALFDPNVLATLDEDMRRQATCVLKALDLVRDGRAADAQAMLADIPRKSLYADWRLFVRGWSQWLDHEFDPAIEAWSRLDPTRRPGRIARALTAARRLDLETLEPPPEGEASDTILDAQNLFCAKLARRLLIDRPAIRNALQALSGPEEGGDLQIGPRRISWLRKFAPYHRQVEPVLVRAIEREAMRRAFAQPYTDLMAQLTTSVPGPPHDPNHLLLRSLFYRKFADGRSESNRYRDRFLKSLDDANPLSPIVCQAIQSIVHLEQARDLIQAEPDFLPYFLRETDADTEDEIQREFAASVAAYPRHQEAYSEYVAWLQKKLEDKQGRRDSTTRLEGQLLRVHVDWSKSSPDAVAPNLWLVQHHLEEGALDKARPYIEWLSQSRQEDPRLRALPWKWQLFRVMQVAGKKSTVGQASELLKAAVDSWPMWLPQDMVPYLDASLLLRQGDMDGFTRFRARQISEHGLAARPLTDASMMLAAAQWMKVPGAALKPLRAPIEQVINDSSQTSNEDLLQTLSFYWDLQRVSINFPAARLHSRKLGLILIDRLQTDKCLVEACGNGRDVEEAVLWLGERKFFSTNRSFVCPPYLEELARTNSRFAAAVVLGALKESYGNNFLRVAEYVELVRAGISTETDAFYRYWLAQVVDQFEKRRDKYGSPSFAQFLEFFARGGLDGMGAGDDDDDEFMDDDDGGLPPDPTCNCPRCTAARRQWKTRRQNNDD